MGWAVELGAGTRVSRWPVPRASAPLWPHHLPSELPGGPVHLAAASGLAAIVREIRDAMPADFGIRPLAVRAGVTQSVAEAALAGRAWPTIGTLARLSCVVGLRLGLLDNPKRAPVVNPKLRLARPTDPCELETAALASVGLPATPPGSLPALGLLAGWPVDVAPGAAAAIARARQQVISDELWWRLRHGGISLSRAGVILRVRPNTVTEWRHAASSGRDLGSRLTFALATLVCCHLTVRGSDRPWMPSPWKR